MDNLRDTFQFTLPAEVVKSEDGEWRIKGLASTEVRDKQGEIILQHGMDLTPIDQKQGYFNFDHKSGVENLIGVIDGYNKSKEGLYVEGRLFKNHDKAKAVYQVMQSLGKSDRGRVGLSVEGKILQRDEQNPRIIKKCQIKNVAVTFNPVNQDTYADLIKSLSGSDIEFALEKQLPVDVGADAKVFTSAEVIDLISKALSVGSAYASSTPSQLSGGDALAQEDLEKQPRKIDIDEDSMPKAKKKLKKMDKCMYKSQMAELLDNIQKLYPDYSRTELWDSLRDRIYKKFPEISKLS